MRFYWNLDLARLVLNTGSNAKLGTVEMIRSSAFPVEVQFIKGGVAGVELDGASPEVGFVIKTADKFDNLGLASIEALTWDSEALCYTGTINLITTALDALFMVDGVDTNDVRSAPAMAGFGYRPTNASNWVPSDRIATTLFNNVFRGDEEVPAESPSLGDSAVLHSSVQSLDSTHKGRARTNIGAASTSDLDGKQPIDADLTLLAGLTVGANQFIARSGSGAVGLKGITEDALAFLADSNLSVSPGESLGTPRYSISGDQITFNDGAGNTVIIGHTSISVNDIDYVWLGTNGTLATMEAVTPTWDSLTGTTPAIVFAVGPVQNLLLALAGNTTFSASGYAQGARIELYLTADSVERTLTFPAWTWLEGVPTAVPAGKSMQVSLVCTGSVAGGVFATFGLEL